MVEILRLILGQDSEDEILSSFVKDSRSYVSELYTTLGSVVPLAMFQL